MGRNSTHAWSILKSGPKPLLNRDKQDYPHHKRACRVYSQWTVGYSDQEIADFFAIQVEDVRSDIQHIQQVLPVRTVIAQENDRRRVIIQRLESKHYCELLHAALTTPASEYLKAGVSPVGALKEFREAVGQTERPGAVSVNVGNTVTVNHIRGMEDIVRAIIVSDPTKQIAFDASQQAIAVGPEEPDKPSAPGEEKGETDR